MRVSRLLHLAMTRAITSLIFLLALPVFAQDADGGTGFTLYQDYNCPDAPPWQQADGGWLASDARKERINCALNGAQGELDAWRGKTKDTKIDTSFTWKTEHWVISILSAILSSEITIIASRSSRGCKAVANPFVSCH